MLCTKQDYINCLEKIITPLKDYYTKGCAGIKCGTFGVSYGEGDALMEAFSRVLWGLGPLWGGGHECEGFDKLCLNGIINGTDPEHEEYWGKIEDYGQKLVETAAIGLTLVLAPHKIWDPLTDKQKDNFHKWLLQANTAMAVDNNWKFFAVLVNLGLKNVGASYNEEVVNHSISRFDSFYRSNGWYKDGNTAQSDYYIAFAMHFYGLIYAKVMEKEDPENSKKFKDRAMIFARDFIYWFDDDGSALAFGRSLTYRFAQCCFWSACVFAGIEPFPMGVMKGIISRNLEWWLSKPIFDNGNVLSVGYAYPNLYMSEQYNAFGSPYWALKTFLILALDDDHEFFKAEVLPLPKLDALHVIPEANMVIQRINGYVTALTAGQWAEWDPTHCAEKYSKFAYSSRYAFSVPRSVVSVDRAATDNMLAFENGDMVYVRRKCIEYRIEENGSVYSKWSPYKGVCVETYIIPTNEGHIRKHTVVCDEECVAYDCAFSTLNGTDGDIKGTGEKMVVACGPNTNLMNPLTKMQAVKYTFPKGTTTVETTVIYP